MPIIDHWPCLCEQPVPENSSDTIAAADRLQCQSREKTSALNYYMFRANKNLSRNAAVVGTKQLNRHTPVSGPVVRLADESSSTV
jgi:hypothetical protein